MTHRHVHVKQLSRAAEVQQYHTVVVAWFRPSIIAVMHAYTVLYAMHE